MHVKLFEDFRETGDRDMCCDPFKLLDAFEEDQGDALRWAAFTVKDVGFEQAEMIADDPEEVQAVRLLRAMKKSPNGVDAIGMLDMLEDWSVDLDGLRDLLHAFYEEGGHAAERMPNGRTFLRRMEHIVC